jgi:hypothetical protein
MSTIKCGLSSCSRLCTRRYTVRPALRPTPSPLGSRASSGASWIECGFAAYRARRARRDCQVAPLRLAPGTAPPSKYRCVGVNHLCGDRWAWRVRLGWALGGGEELVLMASDLVEGSRGCERSEEHVVVYTAGFLCEEKDNVCRTGNAQKYLDREVGDIILLLTQFRPCLALECLLFDSGGRTRRPETPRPCPCCVRNQTNPSSDACARGPGFASARCIGTPFGTSTCILHRIASHTRVALLTCHTPIPRIVYPRSSQSIVTKNQSTYLRIDHPRLPRSVLQSTNGQRPCFGSSDPTFISPPSTSSSCVLLVTCPACSANTSPQPSWPASHCCVSSRPPRHSPLVMRRASVLPRRLVARSTGIAGRGSTASEGVNRCVSDNGAALRLCNCATARWCDGATVQHAVQCHTTLSQ